jgi:uncharacterized damage-inducible protein DinB
MVDRSLTHRHLQQMRSLVKILLLSTAQALAAQAPKPPPRPAINPVMSSTRPHYERVRDYILRAADQMHEADYAFRPVPEVRSFGELLGHIASTQFFFCATALKEQPPTREDFEKTRMTKATIVEALHASFSYCDRAYAMTDRRATTHVKSGDRSEQIPLSTLVLNIGHDFEHYGNLVTYLRLKKLVPPSSAK